VGHENKSIPSGCGEGNPDVIAALLLLLAEEEANEDATT